MNCVMQLEGQEDDVSSVQRVRVSYSQDQVEVWHNEAVTGAAQIAAAIRLLDYSTGGGNHGSQGDRAKHVCAST